MSTFLFLKHNLTLIVGACIVKLTYLQKNSLIVFPSVDKSSIARVSNMPNYLAHLDITTTTIKFTFTLKDKSMYAAIIYLFNINHLEKLLVTMTRSLHSKY